MAKAKLVREKSEEEERVVMEVESHTLIATFLQFWQPLARNFLEAFTACD